MERSKNNEKISNSEVRNKEKTDNINANIVPMVLFFSLIIFFITLVIVGTTVVGGSFMSVFHFSIFALIFLIVILSILL